MQKFFKILLIVGLSLGLLIAVILVVVFIKLPSVSAIGQAINPAKKNSSVKTPQAATTEQTPPTATAASADIQTASAEAAPVETKEKKQKKLAIMADILSPDRPLSDFCGSLKNAQAGSFTSNEQVDAAMLDSISEEKDPRIQAMKPTFRYMMRLPKMNDLIRQAQAASETGDESLFEKADFYAKAFAAFTEIKDHKKDLEALMDRSYYFINLNKLIAGKPEILSDPRIQNYCGNVEQAFNQARPVLMAEERNEFLGLLRELNVTPEEINYDPNYKTQIEFEMSARNISLKGNSWINEIFKNEVPEPTEDVQ